MAPKRPIVGGDESLETSSGRDKKKVKIATARTIAIQNVATLQSSSAGASSSFSQATAGSSKLPNNIDVEKFVEARAFEITAMHDAMKNASASSTHRVWQTLPRHLRRRAASHDVRRVPSKLRDRAKAEMDHPQKNSTSRSTPKRGKANKLSTTESFLKRQRDKSWLETHIWHARRMHMENMWGYRVATQPSEKAYRSSHRAAIQDAILHDASYHALTEINGPELLLKTMLDHVCDPQKAGPSSQRYTPGARTLETHVYQVGKYPFGLVAAITIIWRPVVAPESTNIVDSTATSAPDKNSKGKEKAPLTRSSSTDPLQSRSVWIKSHPCVYESVLQVLQDSASQTLAEYKSQNKESQNLKLSFIDLRGHVNIFEMMGPKSCQVLRGALKPVPSTKCQEFTEFWDYLNDLQSSACLARGMIVGFKVNDPRLNFPPKNAKPRPTPTPKHVFPSAKLADSEIWEENIRINLANPKFTKQQLDERRSKKALPGGPLDILRQDDRIPILLIQRSLETQTSDYPQSIHGWTMIVPAGWGMAFWSSLVYTGTRVGGQRERQTQAYEAETLYFPRDYPFTAAYEQWSSLRESEENEKWEKKPPAKRVNYEKLETKHPWKADWFGVLKIEKPKNANGDESSAFVTTQREVADLPGSDTQQHIQPWLLRGSESIKIISNLTSSFNQAGTLLIEINRLRLKKNLDPLSGNIKSEHLLRGALVNVKLNMCSRGTPEDLAMIYCLDDNSVREWEKTLRSKQNRGIDEEDTPEETTLANQVPPTDSIIGYVTTGHFSLSRGRGFALGAISLTQLLRLEQQRQRLHPNRNAGSKTSLKVGVRNINGIQCRFAHLEVVAAD